MRASDAAASDDDMFEEFLRWRKDRAALADRGPPSARLVEAASVPLPKLPSAVEETEKRPLVPPPLRRDDSVASRTTRDLVSKFDDDEGVVVTSFASWAPKRPSPYGLTWDQLKAARTRAVAALILLVGLSILFAVVGTQTFWRGRITWQGWYTIFVIIVMLACLVIDLCNVSLVFFCANTALLLARIITLNDALSGFSNEGILSTAAMFVIAKAIEKTRVLEWVVRVVLRRPRSLRSALARMLPAVSFWSCFTNNTPIVAVMVPVVETWSIRADIPVSHLLMPMSFAVILGGLVTIIGTSTSLVIQGLTGPLNLGFFQVGALGAPFAVLGVAFLILVGPFLLPKVPGRKAYVKLAFAWHRLADKSPHTGLTLFQSKLARVPGAELLWLKPHDDQSAHFVPDLKSVLSVRDSHLPVLCRRLEPGDLLCYVGVKECIEDIGGTSIAWYAGSQLDGLSFFELQLAPTFPEGPLAVKEFNVAFTCRVRRINRGGEMLHIGSGNIRDGIATIEAGDVLIVEGGFDLLHYQRDPRFKSVDELAFTVGKVQSTVPLAQQLHPFISVITLVGIVILNATALFTIYEAAAMGIILLLVTDTMSWSDVVTAIPGNLMLMICFSFALAAAMNKSGLGALIGESFARAFVGHEYVQLLGVYLCANIITAIAPNSATATIVYPIVVNMAKAGGFNLLAGVYCLMIASSADFLTPFGYQCNLMVQKPGGYSFVDFTRLGLPVTLIGLFLCPAIAMYVWPLAPVVCLPGALNCTNTSGI